MAQPLLTMASVKAARRAGRRGFTLIELMIAVAITTVIASLAVFGYQKYVLRARVAEVTNMLQAIRAAQETYFQQYGTYVTTGDFYPEEVDASPRRWAPEGRTKEAWEMLGARPGSEMVYCQFRTVGGAAGAEDPFNQVAFNGLDTRRPWWYAQAQCDLNGDAEDGGKKSFYEITSQRYMNVFTRDEGE